MVGSLSPWNFSCTSYQATALEGGLGWMTGSKNDQESSYCACSHPIFYKKNPADERSTDYRRNTPFIAFSRPLGNNIRQWRVQGAVLSGRHGPAWTCVHGKTWDYYHQRSIQESCYCTLVLLWGSHIGMWDMTTVRCLISLSGREIWTGLKKTSGSWLHFKHAACPHILYHVRYYVRQGKRGHERERTWVKQVW